MRILFILLLNLSLMSAQSQTLSGHVKDENQRPLNGVTLALLKAEDSSIIKYSVSDQRGVFSFTNISFGQYLLKASHVSYTSIIIPLSISVADTIVPDIILTPDPGKLANVVITVKKPLLEVRAGKTVLNVEGTINAAGNTALELLRRSPGVMLDREDHISMNGKNGVQVFIDGKPSPLAGSDLANYLKTLQSSQIEAIELITNPSAKYEAAGNAGIINIRLKKNKALGSNGSVSAGFNQGVYGKGNAGFNMNYRNTKINIYGSYNYSLGPTQKKIAMYRTLKDSSFDQHGILLDNTHTHNFKIGADYFINKQSTVGVVVNGNYSSTDLTNNSLTKVFANNYTPTVRSLTADNNFKSGKKHMDFDVNYQLNDADGKQFSVNADYGFFNISTDQWQPNFYYNGNGGLSGKVVYHMIAPTEIDIYSLRADYEQPFLKGKLAAGSKISYVSSDNNFQRFNVIANSSELDRDRSNQFLYKENINAAYLNYNRQLGDVQLQAGLRLENTIASGNSKGEKYGLDHYRPYDSSVHQNYVDLFPSIMVNYSKNPDHQLSFSISRRIDRPVYQDLNPFEFKVDDYLMQKGNAYLRPQYTNNASINYLYRQKLNAALNFSHVKDLSGWILDTIDTYKAIVSKKNLASQDVVNFTLSYPFQYKSFSSFANFSGNYSSFKGNFGAGRVIDEKAFGANLFVQNSIVFSKTWTAELTAFYNSPTIQEGNMHSKALWSVDAGIQSKLFNDHATLKFSVSDIFNSLRFRSTSFFAGQSVAYSTKWETRQAKISLVYRFGSSQIKPARQRRSGAEEEMKRVQ